jgi:hypothetical protein
MFSRLLGMKRKKSASAEETERHAKVTLIDAAETNPEIDHPVVQAVPKLADKLADQRQATRQAGPLPRLGSYAGIAIFETMLMKYHR